MSDQDWLDTGHGGGEGLRPMIKGSSGRAVDRASIRSVLRGGEVAPRRPRRRTKAMVGWLLYCCTAVGGTAAAFTVRDTLFPSLGAPTNGAVWSNATAETTLTTEHGSSSTQPATTLPATTVPATTASTPESAETQTVPSVSDDSNGPTNSVDTRGPSNGVPQTGTTVANPSSGPGPDTTVADHPTDTSTPTSASTPGGPEPTTASTPADPGTGGSDPGHQSGKGGGGGGGGEPPTP